MTGRNIKLDSIEMETKRICLRPIAPFHFQTGGGDHESVDPYPRSDTLSAAISYWWFRQYGDVPGFPDQMPFRLSSVFPAVKTGSETVYLYPKPVGISIDPAKHDHKACKKIRWLSEPLFDKWKTGEDIKPYLPTEKDVRYVKRNGAVLVAEAEVAMGTGSLAELDATTRVTIDRVTAASNPFHFVQVFHASDVLLWFYTDIEKSYEKNFIGLLRLLGDEGLGADRTVGMGQFEVEQIETVGQLSASRTRMLNLGVFNPLPEEVEQIDWLRSAYQLETRRGWVSGRSLRRKPVPCVAENAVLKTEVTLSGNVPCVVDKDDPDIPEKSRPDYSVYRDCRGYFVPCK